MKYQVPQIEWTEKERENIGGIAIQATTATHTYHIFQGDLDKEWICSYYRHNGGKAKFKILPTSQELKEWVEQIHYPSALIKAGFKPVSEPLVDTLKWFELAVPEPTDKNKCVQLGCHYEEFAEMLIAVIGGEHLLSKQVENAANAYKSCFRGQDTLVSLEMNNLARNELLDSLCDQIVTALGVGYMFGFDMQKALAEVVRSNFSKFENGKPVFDDNGKIKKGANYTPPQLQEFI